tara:strand:- start:20593 stop:21282 length:690 start_codon:yes stop_codon:yes gene_type:complete
MISAQNYELKTTQKILKVAESLFASEGFDAVSIRQITKRAGVNLAAVHYHFGSKKKLMEQILKRKLTILNESRNSALSNLEEKADGRPLRPSDIVEAFFGVLFSLYEDSKNGGADFLKLLSRTSTDPNNVIWSNVDSQSNAVNERFRDALFKSLPDVPKNEIVWRFHFMIGATVHAIAGTGLSQIFKSPALPEENTEDCPKIAKKRLLSFLVGGLRSPSPRAIPNVTNH